MDRNQKLKELKEELRELKKHNPSHCHGKEGFIDHNMPVKVYQRIEDIEEEIRQLEAEE